MIVANNVSLVYEDGTQGIENLNINIPKGKLVYITGESGSGKTSFLKLLMGEEFPSSGKLEVLGVDIRKDNLKKIRVMRGEIGPVFQEFKLIKGRSSMENIMMGMRFLPFTVKEMRENAIEALEKVGLLDKQDTLVEHLSFGQIQRIAIARAVARKPKLILADEPTGNLDYENAINIMNLLASFRNEESTVVITTHATHILKDVKEGIFIDVDKSHLSIRKRGGENGLL